MAGKERNREQFLTNSPHYEKTGQTERGRQRAMVKETRFRCRPRDDESGGGLDSAQRAIRGIIGGSSFTGYPVITGCAHPSRQRCAEADSAPLSHFAACCELVCAR